MINGIPESMEDVFELIHTHTDEKRFNLTEDQVLGMVYQLNRLDGVPAAEMDAKTFMAYYGTIWATQGLVAERGLVLRANLMLTEQKKQTKESL
jgi:hypothetical protein